MVEDKMKRKYIIFLAAVLSLLIAGGALANGTTTIDWWVLGGGVGTVDYGGELIVDATLGQPVIGDSSADGVSLGAGYWYGSDSTTAVRLAYFGAKPSGSDILISWRMATHVEVLGFDLYRREAGGYGLEKLNPSLIPAQDPGGAEGADYDWFDTEVQAGLTYVYFLEEVSASGTRTRYGPVQAAAMYAVFLP
jgi:hypothetical protein